MIRQFLKYSWLLYSFLFFVIFPATVESGIIPNFVAEKMTKVVEERQVLTQYLANKYNKSTEFVSSVVSSVYTHSKNNGVEPTLVLAIIEKESSFDPKAQSGYGAIGLMQVVPKFHTSKIEKATGANSLTAKQSEKALTQPETNIKVGTAVMAEYIAAAPNIKTALKKYSGSARNYAETVFSYQKELKKKLAQSANS